MNRIRRGRLHVQGCASHRNRRRLSLSRSLFSRLQLDEVNELNCDGYRTCTIALKNSKQVNIAGLIQRPEFVDHEPWTGHRHNIMMFQ